MDSINLFTSIAKEQGADFVLPILPMMITFDFRTTYKCMTCSKYGSVATCPPNIPNIKYFKKLINCYSNSLLIIKEYKYRKNSFESKRNESSLRLHDILLYLEQQAFQRNFYWAASFIGGSCRKCSVCGITKCKDVLKGRIPMEATGIDVRETCRKVGFTLSEFPHPKNRGILHRVGLFLLE
jgi:predicted metal-binding protein